MSTTAATMAMVCLVVHQMGVVRDVKREDVHFYQAHSRVDGSDLKNLIEFPCDLSDNQALDRWRDSLRWDQDEHNPRGFPNDEPWSRR